MPPIEIVYFVVALFLGLAVLVKWKRRRDVITARVRRGLRGYVGTNREAPPAESEKRGERLIPA